MTTETPGVKMFYALDRQTPHTLDCLYLYHYMMDDAIKEQALETLRLVATSNTLWSCDTVFNRLPHSLSDDDAIDHYTLDQLNDLLSEIRDKILFQLSSVLERLVNFAGEELVRRLGTDVSEELISSGYNNRLDRCSIKALTRELEIMQTVRECIASSLR